MQRMRFPQLQIMLGFAVKSIRASGSTIYSNRFLYKTRYEIENAEKYVFRVLPWFICNGSGRMSQRKRRDGTGNYAGTATTISAMLGKRMLVVHIKTFQKGSFDDQQEKVHVLYARAIGTLWYSSNFYCTRSPTKSLVFPDDID